MKKFFTIVLIFSLSISIFCKERITLNDTLISYRNAITEFDNQNYGLSLKYCEEAILYRRQLIDFQIETLKNSLGANRVRAVGDKIDDVLKILNERKETESISIINYYIRKFGIERFDNSISNLQKFIESSKTFPEVHKLMGDIYQLEGEYEFAEEYYLSALSNASVLDVPEEKYEILYNLAELSRLQGDFNEMEIRLLNILTEDSNYKDSALINSMKNTIAANRKDSVEKLFKLYRADSFKCIKAYNLLCDYYYSVSEKDRALSFAALSVITSFTNICESIESRSSVYEYENLEKFFQECSFYEDIIEWGNDNGVWESFNNLAKICIETGNKVFARELLNSLAQFSPVVYWQKDAVLMLENLD